MLDSIIGTEITLTAFFICTAVSLLLGAGTAFVGMFRTRCTQSFLITLVILPAVVQMIIMLVNGNIGAGVAVAGTFSLVRFRSAPGNAREISSIFLAMWHWQRCFSLLWQQYCSSCPPWTLDRRKCRNGY